MPQIGIIVLLFIIIIITVPIYMLLSIISPIVGGIDFNDLTENNIDYKLKDNTKDKTKDNIKEIGEINKIKNNSKFIGFLYDNIPDILEYHKKPKRDTYRIHNGQRKLLLNEVIFLTKYGDLSNFVVYAGAAPSQHTPLLSELFPNHYFDLYDPATFTITETNKIKIFNDYFTDEYSKKYVDKNVLFISDIRSGTNDMNYKEFEEQVKINNQYHIDWINIIKPVMSMLKFRIPFNTIGDYEYLKGDIYLQPFAPIDSAETRLICDSSLELEKYDPKKYENKMYYYNNIIREFQRIKHNIPLDKVEGLCYCSDCNFEIEVWKLYIKNYLKIEKYTPEKIIELMNKASKITERSLLINRHGLVSN